MAFQLQSECFENGGTIPVRFTAQGFSMSPPLSWSEVPYGTQELALICEDPDAPLPKPVVHWIIYGLKPDLQALPQAIPHRSELSEPVAARQGLNTFGFVGYLGPNPNFWHRAHRYLFRLYALRSPSELPPRAGRDEFFRAIDGKVIEEIRLIGLYEKTPFQKAKAVVFWSAVVGAVGYSANQLRKRLAA